MSAETGALAVTPHPLGKPGGPGLFHDRSLSLPPYIQNIAHSLMEKRGMDKSRAIQTAIGVCQNWASGRGDVKPEVRAAASAAIAAWEAAKAKAKATPNKDVKLSQPMALLRTVLDGTPQPSEIVLSNAEKTRDAKAKQKDKGEQKGKHQLPPGAVGWKHNWVPVDKNGNAVGPSQKDMSAQEIKDMAGHEKATKDAIAEAYKRKAEADGKKAAAKAKTAASKAKTAAKATARKEAAAKKRAAAEAKRRAKAKERAAVLAKKKAAAASKAKEKAHQKLVTQATKQALADKKAGRPLTPTQERLLEHYYAQQSRTLDELRNDVKLSQPVVGEAAETVSTVSSQDGARATANTLMAKYPKVNLTKAVLKRRKIKKGAGRA